MKTKLTPNEIAKQWGVHHTKVLAWIANGELRAINAAIKAGGCPRFLVDVTDLAAFEAARTVGGPQPRRQSRRRNEQPIKDYFP